MSLRRYSLVAQSLFYLAAGINHFWHPGAYRPLMPDHYPDPDLMIYLSGAAEVLAGAGLLASIPKLQQAAALGIVAMLVVFLDVHLFMIGHTTRFPGIPIWLLWARLPLQGLLSPGPGPTSAGPNRSIVANPVKRTAKRSPGIDSSHRAWGDRDGRSDSPTLQ